MKTRLLSWLALLGVGLALWRLFFPAIMMVDSVVQFDQAWRGDFNDWHPPLMAIVLHLVLRLGRNVGALTLLVCLAGLFGVRALALAALDALRPALPPVRRELTALGVVGLLLLPLSPLPFELLTFWKDSWCAVVLVWMTALLVRQLTAGDERGRRRDLRLAGLLLLAVALGLLRHNAAGALPLVGVALLVAERHRPPLARALLAIAPLLLLWLSGAALQRLFHVQESHLERHVMAFELVGVCVRSTAACDELHRIRPYLDLERARSAYVPGNLPLSLWGEPPPLDFAALWDGPAVAADFRHTALHHPLLLAAVDVAAFVPLLQLHGAHQFVWRPGIHPNPYGLTMTPHGRRLRERWADVTIAAGESPVWRWFAGVHAVWLLVGAGWLVVLWRRIAWRPLVFAVLPALAYVLTYLLAATSHDYRFLYPATLTLQVLTLAALLCRRLEPGLHAEGASTAPLP